MTLDAQNLDSLFESYRSFARCLKCPEDALKDIMKAKDMDSKKKIADIKSLISTKVELYSSWLLIVDNVVRLNEMSPHFPETGNSSWCKGQVLITAQDTAAIPSETCFIHHITVSKGMMLSDSLSLLASLSGIADSDTGKEVAQALDYQPLALASAATFVRLVQRSRSSFFGWKEYLEKLSDGQRAKTEAFLADCNPSYPNSMTTAISLAVDNAMSTDNVLNHAFDFISLCAQQPLNLELLINYVLNKENDGSVRDELLDADIIGLRIKNCSLFLIEKDDSGVFVRVHQVVKDVIQRKIAGKCLESAHFEVLSWVIVSFYRFAVDKGLCHVDSFSKGFQLVPHLKTLITEIVKHISEVKKSIDLTMKCHPHYFIDLGKICFYHYDYNTATKFGLISLKLILNDDVFEGYSAQGNDGLGDIGRAQLAIYREKPGSLRLLVATCCNFLGAVLHAQCDIRNAKEYYECALAIYEERLGYQHVNVANTLINLGAVLRVLGDLGQARVYFERALAMYRERLGSQHVNVAKTFNSLGAVLGDQGDLGQAKEYFERALAIYQERLGSQHVDVARTFHNLGAVLRVQGDLGQAKEYYERAIAIYQERLGSQHVDVARTFNNLGALLRVQGDLRQAKEYYERAIAIYQESLGSQHIEVARALNNLGAVLRDQGDPEKAKEYYECALAIYKERLGSQHIDIARTFNNLGTVLHDQGDLMRAKEYFERALAIYQERLGSQHVNVARTFHNLGAVLRVQGDLGRAKKYFEWALAIYQERLGSQHVDAAWTFNSLGAVLGDQGDLGRAKEYFKRALAIYQEMLGSHHVHVANCCYNIGILLHNQGDLSQAKEYFDCALTIYANRLGPEHSMIVTIQRRLSHPRQEIEDT